LVNGEIDEKFFNRIVPNASESETEVDEVGVVAAYLKKDRKIRVFDRFTMIL
jgi:hypothetical protein